LSIAWFFGENLENSKYGMYAVCVYIRMYIDVIKDGGLGLE